MDKIFGRFSTVVLLCVFLSCVPSARAQQTLGGITGTVMDESGAVIPGATVTIVGDQTKLTRSLQTTDTGSYDFVNLPIGNYTIAVTQMGFQTLNIPSIQVQANRTVTVNALEFRDEADYKARPCTERLAGQCDHSGLAPRISAAIAF